jgi:hypothetical protein
MEPQALPQEIVKRKEAMRLYEWAILLIGGVLVIIVLGAIILAALNVQGIEWLSTLAIVLATSLASLINGGKAVQNEN